MCLRGRPPLLLLDTSEKFLELIRRLRFNNHALLRFAGTVVEVGSKVDETKWAPGTNVVV